MAGNPVRVRPMETTDLAEVARLTDAAFGLIIGQMTGRQVPAPVMPPLLFPTRFATDPAGCFVACDPAGKVTGAVFSTARGALGWFGPLAVSPIAQGQGVGQLLIAACLEQMRGRGVRLVGLETFAESPFHVHLYAKSGFRPSWTGVSFRRSIESVRPPGRVTAHGSAGRARFRLRGPRRRCRGRRTADPRAVGTTFTAEGGVAICHFAPTFEGAGTGFVPFLAAPTQTAFLLLLDAAEQACAERGLTALTVRVPGSAWRTIDGLVDRGYRAGRVAIRMKLGERPDYDGGDFYYADNWL